MALSFTFNPFTGNFDSISTVSIGSPANGLSIDSSQTLSLALSSTSTTGALSSTDWNTFNGKQSTISIGALDAQAANSNGLALVSNVLSAQSADATHPGLINTTAQTIAGVKTFSSAPNFSSLTASYALVLDASKNVTSLIYSPNNTNSSIASRDSNGNSSFNAVNGTSTATVTSGQTITMNIGSAQHQKTTGTSTCTFKLPDATYITNGWTYQFNNNSTGNVTIQNASAGAVTTVPGGGFLEVTCTDNSTTAGAWDTHWLAPSSTSWGNSSLQLAAGTTIKLQGSSSGALTLTPPSTITSYSVTLPAAQGTGALTNDGSGNLSWTASSGGTVTSVAMSVPSFLSVSGSPITTSGTLAVTLSGTALPAVNGGTGATSFTAYAPVCGGTTTTGALQAASMGISTSGYVLTSNGSSALPSFQAAPSAVTNTYFSGYMSSSSTWSKAGTGFADPTNSGGNALTTINSSGITVTAASSNLPGITFTPAASTSVYYISAVLTLNTRTSSNYAAARITDGTTAFGWAFATQLSSGDTLVFPAVAEGIFVPGTASAVTVKIQLAAGSGATAYLDSAPTPIDSSIPTIQWTVLQIK